MGVSIAAVGLLLTPSRAPAREGFALTRIVGSDRYDTARQVAQVTFPNGAATVVLASGERFPDALAGSFLAGGQSAPVLLTAGARLSDQARTAIDRLRTREVIMLGGRAALSGAVEDELRATDSTGQGGGKLTVTRIAGADRYETARLVATSPNRSLTPVAGKRTVLVATGETFPDALAAGPLAYAAGMPVVLTTGSTLHAEARRAIEDLRAERAVILGGAAAVGANVESQIKAMGIGTERLAGADRAATAVRVAEHAVATLGFSTSHTNLARGDDYADALAGAAHAGRDLAPILLTQTPTDLGAATRAHLADWSGTLTSGHILGAFGAVSDAVKTEAEKAASGSLVSGPRMESASADTDDHTIHVRWSGAVTCADTAATRQQLSFAGATPTVPVSVTCDGTRTMTLKWVCNEIRGGGTLTYTDESTSPDDNDIRDQTGAPAAARQSVQSTSTHGDVYADAPPSMSCAGADLAADTVRITYKPAVTCPDTAATRAQFTYSGATPITPTAISCDDTARVLLRFTDVTAGGTLTYTDDSSEPDDNDLRSTSTAARTPATSPQSRTAFKRD